MRHEVTPPRARLALPCLVAFFTAAILAGCSGGSPQGEPKPAPGFTLTNLEGEQVRLSDFRGKVVVLDFWATWCPPCRAALPHLAQVQKEYREDGLVVLGMNMDKSMEDLDAFLSGQTLNYPILKVDEPTRMAYEGVTSIPVTYVVDREGMIRKKFLGYDHKIAEELERTIQSLLRESS